MATIKDGDCCAWCAAPAVRQTGRIVLCAIHYRFQSMRARAKRDGKYVPSMDDLIGFALQLDPSMTCPTCSRRMNWLAADGYSTVISLQHDRDDPTRCRFLCLACNTRHAAHPGDSFYDLPAGHKRCGRCERVLPAGSFDADRSRVTGLKSHCRECCREEHREWVDRNRERVNQQQRDRRAGSR